MGLPNIESSNISKEQSVSDIIESVALGQAALSHILNAEGEKIQAVLGISEALPDEIMAVNASVLGMVKSIQGLQGQLLSGLSRFGDALMPLAFHFFKKDGLTGAPLSGAVFRLLAGSIIIATAVSGPSGKVTFSGVTPGTYSLQETLAPPGYMRDGLTHDVEVTNRDTITIDGGIASGFTSFNMPFPSLTVIKTSIAGSLIPGAEFRLLSSTLTRMATSDANGEAHFNRVAEGTYTLSEFAPAPGYAPNPTTYAVVVSPFGVMTVNGATTTTVTMTNVPIAPISGTIFWVSEWSSLVRPALVTITLNQNGTPVRMQEFGGSMSDTQWPYSFGDWPQFEPGTLLPYVYTVEQAPLASLHYVTTIDGFDITNVYSPPA